jgi:glycosyltransferase involved in cell wall biosynthesis
MPSEPALSVVMATFNRAETLERTLAHLADQSLDPSRYEVIVVDDGSPDNTRAVVEAWMARVPFVMRYHYHTNRGPGYTQNRGILDARASLVLLMADDIWMSHGALEAHLAAHEADPGPTVAVLGQVQQSPNLDGTVFIRTWDPFRFSDMNGASELPYYRFWACNVSVDRDFMLRNGLFREPMGVAGAAAHEDPELGYRLSRAGLRIKYCKHALGYHHHVVTLEAACRRAFMQGRNFVPFRAQVDYQPEIAVAYHWMDRTTVLDHLRTRFGPRRANLVPADQGLVRLLARYALRGLAFNRITMRFFWKPLTATAERIPAIGCRMHPSFYRGMIAYNFFKGARYQRALSGKPAQSSPLPA